MSGRVSETPAEVHTTLAGQVEEFLLDRRARGLSPFSVRWYAQQLAHLTRALPPQGARDVTPQAFRHFLLTFAESHNPGGAHGAYRAARAFFRWRAAEYDLPDPTTRVPAPRVPADPQEPGPLETVRAMVAICGPDWYGLRDRALLLTLLDSGLRRGELLALDVDDLQLPEGIISVRRGKGGKFRVAFVGSRTAIALGRYLRRRPRSGPLWMGRSGERLSVPGLLGILRRRAKAAGVPAPSPHMFRRAFAIQSLRAGMDLVSLQRLLGHTSLAIVERYLKQLPDDLQAAHRRAGVVDRWGE